LDRIFRRYYKSFIGSFGPLRQSKYNLQLKNLSDLVRSGAVRSVLDVGCGCGTVSLWLSSLGAEVKGIDLKADRLEVAHRRAADLKLSTTFEFQTLFAERGSYDAVWLEQAFHHVEPREEVFAFLPTLLNPGGRIIISDINGWSPLSQIQMLRLRGLPGVRTYVDEAGDTHVYGDERITTPGALDRGFGRHGIQREALVYYGLLPNTRWAERLGVLERLPLPVLARTHYVWTGRAVRQ
jgi:SAM-dependent methyltransferase